MSLSKTSKEWLGATVALAAFGCMVALIVNASNPTPNNNRHSTTRSASLEGSIASSGVALRIKNADRFDWTDCQIGVNPSGASDFGFVHEQARIAAGSSVILPLLSFIDSAGHRFDPASQVPVLATVSCLTPAGRANTAADLR